MAAPAIESWQTPQRSICKGTVIAIDAQGRLTVRAQGAANTVRCDVLEAGLGMRPFALGDSVVFAAYEHHAEEGCVFGRIAPPDAPQRTRLTLATLELDLDELIVSAKSRITLRTQSASLKVTADKVETIATTIVAKARRLQKLLAPMIRLN